MKSCIFSALLIIGAAFNASSQEKPDPYIAKPRLSIGAEFALPTNTGFGELFSTGFGSSAKFEVPLTNYLYATATAGFTEFFLKNKYKNLTFNKTYVPLKAGGKYYFEHTFYAEGELGASIGTNSGAGTAFVWSAGGGVSFPITKDGFLDTGLRVEKWARDEGNITQAGFRIAYKF